MNAPVTDEQKGGVSHNFDVWRRWRQYIISQIGPNPQWDEVRRVAIRVTPDQHDECDAYNDLRTKMHEAHDQWVQSKWPHTEDEWKAIGIDARVAWLERYLDEVAS